GMLDVWIGHIAGVHVIATARMVGFASAHRADNGEFVHDLGGHWHVLADLHVASGADRFERAAGWRAGLEVPDIERRWTTTHPEQNGGFVGFRELRGVRAEALGKGQGRDGHGRSAGQMAQKMTTRHSGGNWKGHGMFRLEVSGTRK